MFQSKVWNILHQDSDLYFFRDRQYEFKYIFSQENDVLFCNDVCSVIEVLGHQQDPTEWRLFIDSSKVSFKTVLLQNLYPYPITPKWKKSYENMKLLLENNRNMSGFKAHCCIAWFAAWLHRFL